jgi:hypothetical protein
LDIDGFQVIADSRELAQEKAEEESKNRGFYVSHAVDWKYEVKYHSEEEIVSGIIIGRGVPQVVGSNPSGGSNIQGVWLWLKIKSLFSLLPFFLL